MARIKVNTTKMKIIQVATNAFLEKGVSTTSAKSICDELDISTGNLTFYFPTKEHILAVLVEMLCDFQWKMMQTIVDEGNTSLMAVCLELATMAAVCEEDEIAKDFYLSVYSSPLSLEIIRKNDAERSKVVFDEYCPDWDEQHYAEAEILASGIEYATLMTTDDTISLDIRIKGALDSIMTIFNVPEEIRRRKIEKVLGMDYRKISKRILKEFKEYVHKVNETAFQELI